MQSAAQTVGERGPILLQDVNLIDEIAHFTHERIPERVVHAKGAGAFGYFEVTHDITKYTCAKLFEKIGKRTVSILIIIIITKDFVDKKNVFLASCCSILNCW